GDPLVRFFAHDMSAITAIERVRLDEADDHIGHALELAQTLGVPALAHNAALIEAWRSGLAGDLAEAERLVAVAVGIGRESGDSHADIRTLMVSTFVRWQQERLDELAGAFDEVPRDMSRHPGTAITRARALVSSPSGWDSARTLLVAAAANELRDVAPDVF